MVGGNCKKVMITKVRVLSSSQWHSSKSIQDGTTIFRHLKHANFKIFSNHGGQFRTIFRHLKHANFKNFSNHGGQFRTIFRHLRHVNFKIFSNHGRQFKTIFSYFCAIFICFKSVKNVSKFGVQVPFSGMIIWCALKSSGVHLPCSADWHNSP